MNKPDDISGTRNLHTPGIQYFLSPSNPEGVSDLKPQTAMSAIIQAEWFEWNYYRVDKDNGPYWLSEGAPIDLETHETPKTYVVRYGQGKIKKVLKKFYRHSDKRHTEWRECFGSHDRMSVAKIIFTIAPEPTAD